MSPPFTWNVFPLEGEQPMFYLAAGGNLIEDLTFGQVFLFPPAPRLFLIWWL